MTIPYNSSIPNPPNDPADDVFVMQTNAGSIATIIAVDHVGFNLAGGGEHEQVTFNSNNVPSVPTTPPVLFTNTVAGLAQLFFYSGNAAHSSNQYIASGNGSTLLLGGIILKWGVFTISPSSSTTAVTFASAFPNNCYVAVACNTTGIQNDVIGVQNTSTSGFTGIRSNTTLNVNYFYIAIGN